MTQLNGQRPLGLQTPRVTAAGAVRHQSGTVSSRGCPGPKARRAFWALLHPFTTLWRVARALGRAAPGALKSSLRRIRTFAPSDAGTLGGDAERVLERALRAATFRGNERVGADDLLLALLEDESIRRALRVTGVSPAVLKEAILPDEPQNRGRAAVLGREAKEIVGRAVSAALRADRDSLLSGDLLTAVLAQGGSEAARLIEEQGVGRAVVLAALAHGKAALEPSWVAAGAPCAEVFLYDDPYSARSLVLDALRSAYGLSHSDAQRALACLDAKGQVSLGVLPSAEALTRARALNTYARSLGAPLLARAVPARGDKA